MRSGFLLCAIVLTARSASAQHAALDSYFSTLVPGSHAAKKALADAEELVARVLERLPAGQAHFDVGAKMFGFPLSFNRALPSRLDPKISVDSPRSTFLDLWHAHRGIARKVLYEPDHSFWDTGSDDAPGLSYYEEHTDGCLQAIGNNRYALLRAWTTRNGSDREFVELSARHCGRTTMEHRVSTAEFEAQRRIEAWKRLGLETFSIIDTLRNKYTGLTNEKRSFRVRASGLTFPWRPSKTTTQRSQQFTH